MWAVYALLSAFFVSTTDPIAKKILKDGDEYIVGWAMLALSIPFLAVFYFSHKIAPLNPGLIKTMLAVLPFEMCAIILYYKALKLTDISLSVPFLALTPVFAILTAGLILGERISPFGMVGIVLITIGVYSLNIKEARQGFIRPVRAIFLNKGSLYMALVALLYSVTSTVSKKAMLFSSPESIPFIYNTSISLAMLPIILYRVRSRALRVNIMKDRKSALAFLAIGALSALSSICYFKSVSLASVAYAISIKRLSLLMSVGYGWLFFKERDIKIRFISTFCMFMGVFLILICK